MLNKIYPKPAAALFIWMLMLLSCAKEDVEVAKTGPPPLERFFRLPLDAGQDLRQLVQRIRVDEQRHHFTAALSRAVGYPDWSQALISPDPSSVSSRSANSSGSQKAFLVPFNQEGEIKAILFCLSDSSGAYRFQLYRKNAFPYFPPGDGESLTRFRSALSVFSFFEKRINNRQETNFLYPYLRKAKDVQLEFTSGQASSRGTDAAGYYDYVELSVCANQWIPNGYNDGTAPGEDQNYGHFEYRCETRLVLAFVEGSLPGSGGGGTGGEGGGGGTSGGESDPNEWWAPGSQDDPYLALAERLTQILQPGDEFYFNPAANPAGAHFFESVPTFQTFLNSFENFQTNLSIPSQPISQLEKIETAHVDFSWVNGIQISVKLKQSGNLWEVTNVASTEFGLTFSWSWDQFNYAQSTVGNEITVDLLGYIKFNVFIQGIGTVWKDQRGYRLKINRSTGKITSLTKI